MMITGEETELSQKFKSK